MDWQYAATAGVVVLALGYLARRGWRTLRKSGCGGCGAKSAAPGPAVTFIPADRLTVRPRKADNGPRNS